MLNLKSSLNNRNSNHIPDSYYLSPTERQPTKHNQKPKR